MITVGVIRNGATYLSHHLRKNDYWTEGERQVEGQWIGAAAPRLGLQGAVDDKAFQALRSNVHPVTGEPLTLRDRQNRVAFFDIQLSAPKDVSVLAMVGGDERVTRAFREAVDVAWREMERYAAVRERRGDAYGTEKIRLTRNFVGALFFHDTSRDLDPQLHAHAVLANATWDEERGQWLALQPAEMLRASGYVRQVLYRELASRLQALGYEVYDMNSKGFAIRGVEHLRERFSKRSRHVQELAEDFARRKGRQPSKREIEILVRESRSDKLADISTAEVRARQRAELNGDEAEALTDLVRHAQRQAPRQQISHGRVLDVLEAALRHAYERTSVVREGEILNAALALHPEFFAWRALREALETHPEAIRRHGEMSLRPIFREERSAVARVVAGRNTRFALGDPSRLPERLTRGQRAAAKALLQSKDFVTVLVGDAGTGKTTVLIALEAAHQLAGGQRFIALAPTTRAREALVGDGFDQAETVQRFLVSETLQAQAARRVILVDEAGLLSTEQLDALTRIADEMHARLLLVGDTKQHYSVQRGDALRNVIKHTTTPVVRLAEVLRQREEADRHFSRLLAARQVTDAFRYAARRGMICETKDDHALFAAAAEHYASNQAAGVETLVVVPFWDEIERFNTHARDALRQRGLLGEVEVLRDAVKPLAWTDEQKVHWDQYRSGDWLLFVRDTKFFRRGTAGRVTDVLPDGVRIEGANGHYAKITRRQRGAFDVGREQRLPVAAGDRLLIRGRDSEHGFENGDFKDVAGVDPLTNQITLADGRLLPPEFKAWTYGHALTSYRAQGSTAEESLIVLGEVAERALMQRQFYVGNTRYRGNHRIYVAHADAILDRLAIADTGRELATEFVQRHQIGLAEEIGMRPFRRMGRRARQVWQAVAAQRRTASEAMRERMET